MIIVWVRQFWMKRVAHHVEIADEAAALRYEPREQHGALRLVPVDGAFAEELDGPERQLVPCLHTT